MNFEIFTAFVQDQTSPIIFSGMMLSALNTNNWEYFELEDGTVWHFRKDKLKLLIGPKYQIPQKQSKKYLVFVDNLFPNGYSFFGVYRRDLETASHHFYQKEDGNLLRFLKTSITAVYGDTVQSILENRE